MGVILEEIWKDIKDYEGLYQISNLGRVKSLDRIISCKNGTTKFCKGTLLHIFKNDYLFVRLCENSLCKTKYIHKLVAQAFIPNPNNLPEVNHKDENKLNNNIDNLEWCTIAYNNTYGTRTQRTRKRVYQLDLNKNIIKLWDGIRIASQELNIPCQQISQCCNGTKYRKTAGGYIWKYESEVL